MSQAKAKRIEIEEDVFTLQNETSIYWLGNGGALITSYGTNILIDPLLEGFDMKILTEAPILSEKVEHVDAVLITHCDNDHFSKSTLNHIKDKVDIIHTTHYVASLCKEENLKAIGHNINESFMVNDIKITLTPADHAWQNDSPKHSKERHFEMEDFCGFRLDTKDGNIWMPGDSRLMEEQLHQENVDLILMDISDSKWHIGIDGVEKMANAYPNAKLIPIHWGCVDAPEWKEFNGDPNIVKNKIINPNRLYIARVGEKIKL